MRDRDVEGEARELGRGGDDVAALDLPRVTDRDAVEVEPRGKRRAVATRVICPMSSRIGQ